MLQRFCTKSEGKNVLQCLKQNKNGELMDPKCKQMITKRQMTQNTGTDTSDTAGLVTTNSAASQPPQNEASHTFIGRK